MKFILGKKIEMTQIFKDDGEVVTVTIVKAGPCYITQIKTKEKNGYCAVQIGFEETKKHRLTKPKIGHLKKTKKPLKHLSEFRLSKEEIENLKIGDKISVDIFENGEKVNVTGTSKGKGFQGVVKRHGFAGSPASHGHKDQLRMPGSIGATDPARVFKGLRMAGHTGSQKTTIKNLTIEKIDKKSNLIYIKGAIPGYRGSILKIKSV